MGRKRGAPRRVDGNHAEVVDALRKGGYHVEDLSALGGGFPDLLVLSPSGGIHLVEIKNRAAKGKLNKLQQKWHEEWRGEKPAVVYSAEEALQWLAEKRRTG
jgi:hypothetical protein